MTLEVAEFLRHKFLKSIRDAESEISGFIFTPYFTAIKCLVKEMKMTPATIPLQWGVNHSLKAVSLLYDLNDALAECRVFANEWKKINKKLLHLNPFTRKMKKRLHALKCQFAALDDEEKFRSSIVICDWTSEEADRREREMADRRILIGQRKKDLFGEPKMIRSDEHAEEIEGLLFGNGFTAIGIVGIAGVGKTTLVHQVLNRQRVKDEFSPIIWLCLSDIIKEKHVFTYRISIRIVTYILHQLGEMSDCNGGIDDAKVEVEVDNSSLRSLLERLNELLSSRRYLIVLDDVWHNNNFYSDLGSTIHDRLSIALPKGSGGAVIVTTRIPEVAQQMVGTRNMILVKPLDRESCWGIFQETIKDEVLYMSTRETLAKISNEIKDQCYGLPLAAKELAKIIPKQIRSIESNRFVKEMYIPDELLQPDLGVIPAVHIPKFPVLVFVDMRRKQHSEKVLDKYRYQLNKKQIVGQDSVVNWILGIICDLKLPELPSIAPIPLETSFVISGSISKSFGWNCSSRYPMLEFSLEDIENAKKMKTDRIRSHSLEDFGTTSVWSMLLPEDVEITAFNLLYGPYHQLHV